MSIRYRLHPSRNTEPSATNVKQFPLEIIAGDTLQVEIKSVKYKTTEGFSLIVQLHGPSGAPVIYEYVGTGSPNYFEVIDDVKTKFKLPPAVTATFIAGSYSYSLIATDGTDEYTIEAGRTLVEPRAADITDTDTRTHFIKMLEAINALLENRATKDQQSYSIAGRSLTRIPVTELLKLRDYYAEKVAIENTPRRTKLFVRMRGDI